MNEMDYVDEEKDKDVSKVALIKEYLLTFLERYGFDIALLSACIVLGADNSKNKRRNSSLSKENALLETQLQYVTEQCSKLQSEYIGLMSSALKFKCPLAGRLMAARRRQLNR